MDGQASIRRIEHPGQGVQSVAIDPQYPSTLKMGEVQYTRREKEGNLAR